MSKNARYRCEITNYYHQSACLENDTISLVDLAFRSLDGLVGLSLLSASSISIGKRERNVSWLKVGETTIGALPKACRICARYTRRGGTNTADLLYQIVCCWSC